MINTEISTLDYPLITKGPYVKNLSLEKYLKNEFLSLLRPQVKSA